MKKKILAGVVIIFLAFIYYYVTLPAVNIHESGFWAFLGGLVLLILIIYGIRKRIATIHQLKSDKVLKGGLVLILARFPFWIKSRQNCWETERWEVWWIWCPSLR